MKQKILLLALALLGCMNVVKAESTNDGVTIGDLVIQQGGFGYITINCTFNERSYDGLSFKFMMPKGLHFDSATADASLTGISNPMFPTEDGNNVDIPATFMFINMGGVSFNKGEYELAKVYFRADEDMVERDYPITITEIDLSAGGTNYEPTKPGFKVTVEAPHPRILKDTATELPEDNYSYIYKEYYTVTETDINGKETDVLKERILDEGTYPEDFIVERTIKANTWSTMCLPFKLTFDELYEAFGDDAVFAAWDTEQVSNSTPWTYNKTNDQLDLYFYTLDPEYDSETFDTRKPFLVKTSKDISDFTVNQKYLGEYNESTKKYTPISEFNIDFSKNVRGKGTSYFRGVLAAGLVPDGCLFISGNKFYYSTGQSSIKAFRAYFELSENLSNKSISQGANVGIMINDTPTYIEGISTRYVGNDDVYSVSGIKMGTTSDLNSMKPGMYIVNGKKVIIK